MNLKNIPRKPAFIMAMLAISILAAYWGVFNQGFSIYDDDVYVTANDHVKSGLTVHNVEWAVSSGEAANWHPLTWVSHMIDCELFGLDARYHHGVNVLFHIIDSILLFVVFWRMTDTVWQSAIVAAIFALHPLHVESVVWIAERKDVLSAMFWMIILLEYYRYVKNPTKAKYVLVIVTFAAGLMAKPMLVTMPFLLILLDAWPLKRFRMERSSGKSSPRLASSGPNRRTGALKDLIFEKLPLFGLAGVSAAITFIVQRRGGAMEFTDMFPLSVRISNAAVSYLKYIEKLFFPRDLSVFYPHEGLSLPAWQIVGSAILLIGISVFVFRNRQKSPPLMVGWFWFLGTLIPVIGIVQVGFQSMADRYMYMPMTGLLIALVWGIPTYLSSVHPQKSIVKASIGLLLAILFLGARTQVGYWKDDITLFRHAVEVTSDNWIAHNNLGAALAARGDTSGAIENYEEAVRIRPGYSHAQSNLAVYLLNRNQTEEAFSHFVVALRLNPADPELLKQFGILLMRQGRPGEAIVQYTKAIRISSPSGDIHYLLAEAYMEQNTLAEAERHCLLALGVDSSNANALSLFGEVSLRQGNLDQARNYFHKAIEHDSKNPDRYYNAGVYFDHTGDLTNAAAYYDRAIAIDRTFWKAEYGLANLAAKGGNTAGAADHLMRALRLNNGDAELQTNAGKLYGVLGEYDSAMTHFEAAIAINPHYVMAHFHYGNLLARLKQYPQAAEQYATVVRDKPDFKEGRDALMRINSILKR